jgi:hypothetical protein
VAPYRFFMPTSLTSRFAMLALISSSLSACALDIESQPEDGREFVAGDDGDIEGAGTADGTTEDNGADDDGFGAQPPAGTNPGDPGVETGDGDSEPEPPATDPPEAPADPADPANPSDPGVPVANSSGQVCYPGANNDGTACISLVSYSSSWSGYGYPSHSSSHYQRAKRFVDLTTADASMKLAPNFTLGELMQAWKGPYGVYQTHVVKKLQEIRNVTGGALYVNSGYRSPKYNKSVGGATYSRHMFGDAVDMRSGAVSLNSLKSRCQALGADYVGMYTNHIHCDWRYHAKDPAFYSSTQAAIIGGGEFDDHDHDHSSLPIHDGELLDYDGVLYADVTGFDEGEPYREWVAFDANGAEIEVYVGESYEAPVGAETVLVEIGGQVTLFSDVDAGGRMVVTSE